MTLNYRHIQMILEDTIADHALREANVLGISSVRAAVPATTGAVSILHGKDLDEDLLSGA